MSSRGGPLRQCALLVGSTSYLLHFQQAIEASDGLSHGDRCPRPAPAGGLPAPPPHRRRRVHQRGCRQPLLRLRGAVHCVRRPAGTVGAAAGRSARRSSGVQRGGCRWRAGGAAQGGRHGVRGLQLAGAGGAGEDGGREEGTRGP